MIGKTNAITATVGGSSFGNFNIKFYVGTSTITYKNSTTKEPTNSNEDFIWVPMCTSSIPKGYFGPKPTSADVNEFYMPYTETMTNSYEYCSVELKTSSSTVTVNLKSIGYQCSTGSTTNPVFSTAQHDWYLWQNGKWQPTKPPIPSTTISLGTITYSSSYGFSDSAYNQGNSTATTTSVSGTQMIRIITQWNNINTGSGHGLVTMTLSNPSHAPRLILHFNSIKTESLGRASMGIEIDGQSGITICEGSTNVTDKTYSYMIPDSSKTSIPIVIYTSAGGDGSGGSTAAKITCLLDSIQFGII